MIETGCAHKDKCNNLTHKWDSDTFLNFLDWEEQIKYALCVECTIEMSSMTQKSVYLRLRNHVVSALKDKKGLQ